MSGSTILQTDTVASFDVGWSVPLSFAQFNPSSGTLNTIAVGVVGDITGTAAIENLGATSAEVQVNLPGTISVAASDGTVLTGVSPDATQILNLGAYDGTTDFAGASGTVVSGFSNIATTVADYTPAGTIPAQFVGTGSIDLTASSNASSALTAYGNLLSLTTGQAGATVSLRYDFTSSASGSGDQSSGSVEITTFNPPPLTLSTANEQTTPLQTLRIADTKTGWNATLAADRFNPSLGTLEAVNLTLISDINANLAAENLGSIAGSVALTDTANIKLALPGTLGVVEGSPSISQSWGLGTFDGLIDFAGTSGKYVTGLTGSLSTISQLNSYYSDLSAFIGTGTIALPVSAYSPSTLTGPADLAAELLTDAGATVEISYTYVPATTSPQASTVAGLTISGTQGGQVVTEQTTVSPFANVVIADTNVVAGNPNIVENETVKVTLSSAANGTLSNLGAGGYDATTGVYTVQGSPLVVSAALQHVLFTPTPNKVAPGQIVSTGFTISDIDLSGSSVTDITTSVITTAGVAIDTAAVAGKITAEIGSLAVAPTITGTVGGQAVADTGTVTPFSGIAIVDANIAQTESVVVTLSSAVNGTLGNLAGGSYNATTGVYTDTGSAAAVTAALAGLVFTPTAHQVPLGQTVTTGFTVTDTDTARAIATDSKTTVIATIGTVAPTIAGTIAGQVVADTATITPFAGVTIGDLNAGQTETVTVRLSAAANGTLTHLGVGSYNVVTGVYTVTGSAEGVTAALDGLVFTPKAGEAPVGQTVTTGFAISDVDTAGAVTTDSTTSVVATGSGSVSPNEVVLPGPSSQYVVADDTGSLYIKGPAGPQVLPGINQIAFTDGTGIFDATGSAENIARLYRTVLDRAPDVAGLLGLAAQVDGGIVPLLAIATAFVASPEFIADYGSLSNTAFVNQVYENGLARPPDAGSAGWVTMLANGLSRGTVALDIAESSESKTHSLPTAGDKNSAEVYRLYRTVFDRAPDAGGSAGWVAGLAAGGTITQAAQGFVNSAEFQHDYGSLSISDFLTALYHNALGRTPAASEVQGWSNALQGGVSEASVIVGFSDSIESRVLTAGVTHANWVFIPS